MTTHELAKKLLNSPNLPVYHESAPWGHHREIKKLTRVQRKNPIGRPPKKPKYHKEYILLNDGIPIL